MSHNFRLLSCLLVSVIGANCANAVAGDMFQVTAAGNSSLVIDDHEHHGKVSFRHSVDGYEVSCDQKTMAVWGKPLKINVNNPQDSDLTIVDLQILKSVRDIPFGKGIFGVEFLKEKPLILLDTDAGALIDFATGKTKPSPPNLEFGPEAFPRESCGDFKFKSYRRYKE